MIGQSDTAVLDTWMRVAARINITPHVGESSASEAILPLEAVSGRQHQRRPHPEERITSRHRALAPARSRPPLRPCGLPRAASIPHPARPSFGPNSDPGPGDPMTVERRHRTSSAGLYADVR